MSDEIKKRKMLLRDFQAGLMAIQASDNIGEKFGRKGYGVRTVQRWYKKFREGDFDLNEKPSHGSKPKKKPANSSASTAKKPAGVTNNKPKRSPTKEVKVDSVTFKHEKKRSEINVVKDEAIEKLIQRKPELTVSKVNNRAGTNNPYSWTRRSFTPLRRNTAASGITTRTSVRRSAPAAQVDRKKQQVLNGSKPRTVNGLEADLKLPPNIAKRMAAVPTSTESHSIGEGRRTAQKTAEGVTKQITVQFQNLSPDVAKNTIRKAIEPVIAPSIGNKRPAVPQSTLLSSPKGVIYLNPQEIFRQSFGFQSTAQRPAPSVPCPKPVGILPITPTPTAQPTAPPQAMQSPMTVSESDSEDDLVFPENISLPPPKLKAEAGTFTTYWDMETDKPILLNPDEDLVANPQVIEID